MENDEGYSLPQQAVRKLVRLIQSLDEVARHFEGQDYLFQGIRFLCSNSKKMLVEDNRDLWKKTNLKDKDDLATLTHDVSVLIWVALSLGRVINQYRAIDGKKPINWTKAAESIDKDETKAERSEYAKRPNL